MRGGVPKRSPQIPPRRCDLLIVGKSQIPHGTNRNLHNLRYTTVHLDVGDVKFIIKIIL